MEEFRERDVEGVVIGRKGGMNRREEKWRQKERKGAMREKKGDVETMEEEREKGEKGNRRKGRNR